jgi:hypothetical protein
LIIYFLDHVCALGYFAIIPVAIIGWLARPTRAICGFLLYAIALCVGLDVWIYSAATVLHLWGWFFVVLGILLGGIGVIPMALLANGFHGSWPMFGYIVINSVIAYVVTFVAAAMWEFPGKDKSVERQGA